MLGQLKWPGNRECFSARCEMIFVSSVVPGSGCCACGNPGALFCARFSLQKKRHEKIVCADRPQREPHYR